MKNIYVSSLLAISFFVASPAYAQENALNHAFNEFFRAINPRYENFIQEKEALKAALASAEQMSNDNPSKAVALWAIIEKYRSHFSTQEIEDITKSVITIREKTLGKDSELLIEPLCALAELKQEAKDKANILARALVIERTHLNPDNKLFVETLDKLADAYLYSNQQPLAITLRKEILTLAVKAHASTLVIATRQCELADLYSYSSITWPIAASMFKQSIPKLDATPGVDKKAFAIFLLQYGHLLERQKKYAEADPVFRKCMSLLTKNDTEKNEIPVMEKNHKLTIAMQGLASSCFEMGNLNESEELYRRALQLSLDSWGAFLAAQSYDQLAEFYYKTGRLAEAERNYKDEITKIENNKSFDDHELPNALYKLGTVYRSQGKLADAVGLYKRAINECTKEDKSANAEFFKSIKLQALQDTLNALAFAYKSQGNLKEQRKSEQELLAYCKKEYGQKPGQVLEGMYYRALIHNDSKQVMQAQDWYQRAIQFGESNLPKDKFLVKARVEYGGLLKRLHKNLPSQKKSQVPR